MVNRFDETGCWVNDGEFVNYTDYRELEVRHGILLKGISDALSELEYPAKRVIAIDDAVCTATNLLMNAIDRGGD
jgi:hypothetical protein